MMDNLVPICIPIFILLIVGSIYLSSIRTVQEHERVVVFRSGRAIKVCGPGNFYIWPFRDSLIKVDIRDVVLDLPNYKTITADNIEVEVNGIVYFGISDPMKAILSVEDYRRATWQLVQANFQSVIGQFESKELLQHREIVNELVQQVTNEGTKTWGVTVSRAHLKHFRLLGPLTANGQKLEPKFQYLTKIRQLLLIYFNSIELRTLCVDLGLDYDDLSGSGKIEKVLDLIGFLDRRGRTLEILELILSHRPNVHEEVVEIKALLSSR